MTEKENNQTEYHLQEALWHLNEALNGDLRQTDATAIQSVADTVATVLRDYKQGK